MCSYGYIELPDGLRFVQPNKESFMFTWTLVSDTDVHTFAWACAPHGSKHEKVRVKCSTYLMPMILFLH